MSTFDIKPFSNEDFTNFVKKNGVTKQSYLEQQHPNKDERVAHRTTPLDFKLPNDFIKIKETKQTLK